jgi:2-polyprenyl-3-methyl-5-hydroxy-6-metoxy-1,4-benzoquinol methylase
MIAYAACVEDPARYEEFCRRGLQRVTAGADVLIEADVDRSLPASCNEVLDAVKDLDDLEALVLLRDHAEVTDASFAASVRAHLAAPEVALLDTAGDEVLVLSPWAVRNLRFDEERGEGLASRVRPGATASGRRVVTAALPVVARDARPQGAGVRETHGEDGYFEHTRPELRALVPASATRVLDVGCGGGALGAALKAERGPAVEVLGLEGFPEAAARARERLDDALCLDLDALTALPPEAGTFDAMIFGDVLEHLLHPVRLLEALLPALRPDGVLVFSVPNVKHWSVLFPLLVRDRWTYEDAGLLDRTHVHFFTLEEFSDVLDGLGLEGTHVGVNDHAPLPPAGLPLAGAAAALGADCDEAAARLGAYQYLIAACRAPVAPAPAPRAPAAAERLPDAGAIARAAAGLVPAGARRVLDLAPAGAPDLPLAPEREVVRVDAAAEHAVDAIGAAGPSGFDAVVVRGLLERLRDPAPVLEALRAGMDPGAALVCAAANVRHWSIVLPLLGEDRWAYAERGLLARHNLRFFTRTELAELLPATGWAVAELHSAGAAELPEAAGPVVDVAVGYGADRDATTAALRAEAYVVLAHAGDATP